MANIKCRVLCIDDHDDTSEMLRLILSHEEYDVDTATTIQEALAKADSGGFDLYVLDRHLPDGSGLELCQQLSALTPGVPCIFYSGDAYDIHRSEAFAAGADGYVAKPDIEGLIQHVNRLLADRACATSTATA
jgi:DNA-binding response OmpR family regulator